MINLYDNNSFAINYLRNIWYKTFSVNHYYTGETIYGISTDDYKNLLEYLIKYFKEDVLFDYLYEEYVNYVTKKNINKKALTKNEFERQLLNFSLVTNVGVADDYNTYKYVSFNTKGIFIY